MGAANIAVANIAVADIAVTTCANEHVRRSGSQGWTWATLCRKPK
jgi:hypothetical protein